MSVQNLIWIDLEMTGLDILRDHIIEIATVVTDKELHVIAEGPVLAIRQEEEILNSMDEWNIRQHTQSGLIERVRSSAVDEAEAEQQTLHFLHRHAVRGASPMCGNSICWDRRFLYRCMPRLESFFHYRNVDVSSIKELALRWYPSITESLIKHSTHLALDDIRASINELRYYRQHLFV